MESHYSRLPPTEGNRVERHFTRIVLGLNCAPRLELFSNFPHSFDGRAVQPSHTPPVVVRSSSRMESEVWLKQRELREGKSEGSVKCLLRLRSRAEGNHEMGEGPSLSGKKYRFQRRQITQHFQ